MVGTSTLAPSEASATVTGTVRWMSSPGAGEDRMRAGAHDEEEVAGRAAIHAGVAFALQADALAVARAGLDAEFDGLCFGNGAFAVAGGAVVRGAAGSVAARAGDVELHAAAHLRDLAGAVALGAGHRAAGVRLAVAGGACLLAVDLEARLTAADGGPEIDGGLIFEVGAGLRAARMLLMRRR